MDIVVTTFILYTLATISIFCIIMYFFMRNISSNMIDVNKEMGNTYDRLLFIIKDSCDKTSKSTMTISGILEQCFCNIDSTLGKYNKEKELIISKIECVLIKAEDVLKETQEISKGQEELRKVSYEISLKADDIIKRQETHSLEKSKKLNK